MATAPARRREEADRLPVGREERGKGTLGIGQPAGTRLVELAHPEGRVRTVVADERHPPPRGAIASRMLPIDRMTVLSPRSSVARIIAGAPLLRAVRCRDPAVTPASSATAATASGQEPAPAAAARATGRAGGPHPRRLLVHERRGELGRRGEPVGRELLERGQHRVLDVRRDTSCAAPMSPAGSSVITLATMACAVGPVNGGSPTSIS